MKKATRIQQSISMAYRSSLPIQEKEQSFLKSTGIITKYKILANNEKKTKCSINVNNRLK